MSWATRHARTGKLWRACKLCWGCRTVSTTLCARGVVHSQLYVRQVILRLPACKGWGAGRQTWCAWMRLHDHACHACLCGSTPPQAQRCGCATHHPRAGNMLPVGMAHSAAARPLATDVNHHLKENEVVPSVRGVCMQGDHLPPHGNVTCMYTGCRQAQLNST